MKNRPVEAAARAICRRRILVNQERSGLRILSEAALQETVDKTWRDYAEDARAALEAVAEAPRREDPEGPK